MNDTDDGTHRKPAATPILGPAVVYVCTNLRMSGSSCAGRASKALFKALQTRADERALSGGPLVSVRPSVCMGYCGQGPNVKIIGGAFHHGVELEAVDAILNEAQKPKPDKPD